VAMALEARFLEQPSSQSLVENIPKRKSFLLGLIVSVNCGLSNLI